MFIKHLSIVNALLPDELKMPPKPIEVLALFMLTDAPARFMFSTVNRKSIMSELGLSTSGLTNHLNSLKNGKWIIPIEDGYEIWNVLIPNSNRQSYVIHLVNSEINETHPA